MPSDRPHGQHDHMDRESYRTFLAAAGAGVCETDANGIYTYASDRYCELLGRSREQLIGKLTLTDVTHPDDRSKNLGFTDSTMRNGRPFGVEMRYLCPDDSVVWVLVYANWIGQSDDPSRRCVSVVVDISERKRAEQALRNSEARLAAIFAHAPVSLCELSVEGKFLRVNDELCKLVGRSREELLTMNAVDVTHPDDIAHTERSLARLIKTGVPASLDKRYLRSDGGIVFANSSISRLDDEHGRPEVILAVTVDLTERHKVEAALLKSEERYRTLFTSIDEGFCVMEVLFEGDVIDLRYLQANPAFEKQAGVGNVVGKRQRELVPDLEQYWFDINAQVALTGEPRRYVNEARRLNRWYDVYAFRIDAPEDHHVAAVFTDITDHVRKQAELTQADHRKNEFLAVLAHELRNPLAPIRSGLEILRMSHGKPKSKVSERLLELMDRQMQQMVRLVDDLLDVSRITQGKVRIQPTRATLQSIISNAIEGSRPLIDASCVSLIVSVPPAPVVVEADSARLAQVFSNLLNNAAKYTDPNGKVWLTAQANGKDVVVAVRDSGTGIPAEMLNSIFDAFTQVDNSMARSRGGLGVGLSLVRTLVELHGGSVAARSEGPGKGSEFVVRLPGIVNPEPISETRPTVEQDNGVGSHRILVVDDNADAAEALAMMLRMIGNDVQVAYSGREGLSLAGQIHPDLILLDLGMPELDGYEVARRLRSDPRGHSTVITALTGWGQEEDRQRSREAGIDHHLVKPVDLGALRTMLKSVPSHQRM
ncbi:MAG: PAS domain S-box protein [Cellvibrionaceae bacterium]